MQPQLTDQNGELVSDALSIVTAYRHFPNCPRSREQYISVVRKEHEAFWSVRPKIDRNAGTDEYDAYWAAAADDYQASEVIKAISAATNGKLGQHTACGLVALCLTDPKENGDERSLYSAITHVEEFQKNRPDGGRVYSIDDFDIYRETLKHKKMPTGYRQIERAFQDYASVAHICAGAIVAFEHVQAASAFAITPERDEYILRTIAHYEHLLRKHSYIAERIELFEIEAALPKSVMELEPLPPI